MVTTSFISVILFYYAYFDIPANKYINRMADDESVRLRAMKMHTDPSHTISNKLLFDIKYFCIIIIAMKCLSILEW